jgi:hypothetical protein
MDGVFISYARDDRAAVERLAQRLAGLVDGVWYDQRLHGAQDWWVEILYRIRSCQIFLAVVSQASLQSEACRIEREYARSVGRTIMPVAIEEIPVALPRDLATRQIVDFAKSDEGALTELARALLGAPDPGPLPDPLPAEPEPPLSYLTKLVDVVQSSHELSRTEQLSVIAELEPGVLAVDRDERAAARDLLLRMSVRPDLTAAADREINRLLAATPKPPLPSPSHQSRWLAVAAVGLGVTVVAAALAIGNRPPDDEPQISPTATALPEPALALEDDQGVAVFGDQPTVMSVESGEKIRPVGEKGWQRPTISPDRRTISLLEEVPDSEGDFAQPWLVDADGGNRRPLLDDTHHCQVSGRPAWSESGDKIAIVCPNSSIWVGDVQHAPDQRLQDVTGWRELDTTDIEGSPNGPATWGGDSRLVVLAASDGGNRADSAWVLRDTGEADELSIEPSGTLSSPDVWQGRLLILSRQGVEPRIPLVLNLRTSGTKPLELVAATGQDLQATHDIHQLTWSPQGDRILIRAQSKETDEQQLFVAVPDGSAPVEPVPGSTGVDSPPAWGSR